jgi:uncharacterized protein
VRRLALVLVPLGLALGLGACALVTARAGGQACDGAASAAFRADGSPRLVLEVARTDQERATGLMNRQSLAPDSGMVFVFPQATSAHFWMKDTLIPLSIAFVAEDGTILDVQEMQAESLDQHASPAPYRYAIEAAQGWFTQHGVRPGQNVDLCFAAG